MANTDKFYINGQWATPSTKGIIEVHNAGTGAVMGTVPAGEEKDMNAAVDAARAAFDSWSQTPAAKRADHLANLLADDEIAKADLADLAIHIADEQLGELGRLGIRVQLLQPDQHQRQDRRDHIEPAIQRIGDAALQIPMRRARGLDHGAIERPERRAIMLGGEERGEETHARFSFVWAIRI